MTEPKRIVDPLECAQAHVERGRLFAAVGRADDALGEYRRAKAVTERAGLTNEVLVAWRPGMARTLASLGRWEEAQAMARDHFAAARTFGSRRTLGTARRAMADVTRDSYERFTWLTEALTFLEESQSQLEAAGVMIDLGALLLERRNGQDARPLLEQGLALASACKSELLVKAATSHLSPSAARARPAQVTGVASLTPAELRAVTLASANATNRDIADQLYVNLKTIEGHLSRAYRKLGITSRFRLGTRKICGVSIIASTRKRPEKFFRESRAQVIEKAHFGRENPRKSKLFQPRFRAFSKRKGRHPSLSKRVG